MAPRAKVERFPKVVPMEHEFLGKFYVRDCYDEYYMLVLELQKGPRAYALEEKEARDELEKEARVKLEEEKEGRTELEEEKEGRTELEGEKEGRAELEEETKGSAELEEDQEPPTTPDADKKRGVTITGTPGIGKSVFMGYFYRRYRKEHPGVTIIMSSYNRSSILTNVVIDRGAKVVSPLDDEDAPDMARVIRAQVATAKK